MDRLSKGLERAVKALAHGPEACFDAAEAIMTTDHVPKMAAYAWHEGDERYVVGGIAKGSGMISPSMATMLAFVVTDAPMSRAGLQDALREAADGSFNMISVDGDMSTNDSCLRVRADPERTMRPPASARRSRRCAATSRSRWCATAKARRRRWCST